MRGQGIETIKTNNDVRLAEEVRRLLPGLTKSVARSNTRVDGAGWCSCGAPKSRRAKRCAACYDKQKATAIRADNAGRKYKARTRQAMSPGRFMGQVVSGAYRPRTGGTEHKAKKA